MSLLDLFGINPDAKAVDAIRSGKQLRENVETKQKTIQDILNENPELVNNLQTNLAPVGPFKIESPIGKAYNFLMKGRVTNPFDTTNKLGILDLVNTGKFFSNPTFGSAIFSPFAPLAIKGIAGLVSNIQNPYTDVFGNLNKQTKEAIEKENLKDFYDRYDKGEVDFTGGITSAQDKARGGQYDKDEGDKDQGGGDLSGTEGSF
tara:strand:- start:36 stop:647 length:612 start_codon:yes stop_codon:yes gene_type:complete